MEVNANAAFDYKKRVADFKAKATGEALWIAEELERANEQIRIERELSQRRYETLRRLEHGQGAQPELTDADRERLWAIEAQQFHEQWREIPLPYKTTCEWAAAFAMKQWIAMRSPAAPPEQPQGKRREILISREPLTKSDENFNEAEIDAQFAEMANDPEYQAEAIRLATGSTPPQMSAREWLANNRHKFLTGEWVYPHGAAKEKVPYLDEAAMLESFARSQNRR